MTFLPIVERELRIAARLTATYRNRTLITAAVAGVAILVLLFGSVSPSPAYVGRVMFRTLSYLALVFCLLEGVRQTADCLSEEKREGTMGLLFLTDLKGYDVVLGKMAAVALKSVYGLMAILPVLAWSLLLGGVTAAEYWRMVLALFDILFFSLCAGIWVSSWSRQEREAMGRAFFVIALISVVPLLARPISMFSPLSAFHKAFAANFGITGRGYWLPLIVTHLMSWGMLIWASLALPRTWQEMDVTVATPARRPTMNTVVRSAGRAQMLDINPAFWLASRNTNRLTPTLILAILVGVGAAAFTAVGSMDFLPLFAGFCIVINLILKMRVAAQASSCLAEARRNNALEMLLATPLTVDAMIQGQLLALRRFFLVPVIMIVGLEALGMLLGTFGAAANAYGSRRNWDASFSGMATLLIFGTGYLAVFVLDMFAVIWGGMWFGLSSKKESQAATKTILIVLLAPLLASMFSCLGLPVIIGWPVFWIAWARSQLHAKFRELASQRYFGKAAGAGWLPSGVASAGAPGPPRPSR